MDKKIPDVLACDYRHAGCLRGGEASGDIARTLVLGTPAGWALVLRVVIKKKNLGILGASALGSTGTGSSAVAPLTHLSSIDTDAGSEAADKASVPDLSADSPALPIFEKIHPVGFASGGALIAALIGHLAFDTERLVGSMAWWQWLILVVVTAFAFVPEMLNKLRVGIESISKVTGQIVWVCGWLVFVLQMFNVVTRYANPLFEADILIGQTTSLAWQVFGVIALLGLNYGVRNGVNPRIDFWWADWSDRKKAWLDFVMHTFFLLPFLYSMTIILQSFAATALGQRRGDGSWPEGWQVWNTWENSPDADQLPLGPIKALIFVGFVFFALQIAAEIIKTGFVLMGNRTYGQVAGSEEMQRIE